MKLIFKFYSCSENFLAQKPYNTTECVGVPPTNNSVFYCDDQLIGRYAVVKRIDYAVMKGVYSATIHCVFNKVYGGEDNEQQI